MQVTPTPDLVFAFIRTYIAAHGYPPTIREIGKGCYLGIASTDYNVQKLAKAGRITVIPRQARGIRLCEAED